MIVVWMFVVEFVVVVVLLEVKLLLVSVNLLEVVVWL